MSKYISTRNISQEQYKARKKELNALAKTKGMRVCSSLDDCVHPNGPILPATTEYFYPERRTKSGLFAECIMCNRLSKILKVHDESYDEHFVRIAKEDELIRLNLKECNACRAVLPANTDYFCRNKQSKDGLHYLCKSCANQEIKAYYNPNTPTRIKRRGRTLDLYRDYTKQDWLRALEYFDYKCPICGRSFQNNMDGYSVAMDHWIPVSDPKCPGTIPTNIVPLCHGYNGCNNSKSNEEAFRFLSSRFGKERAKEINQTIQDFFDWVARTRK